MKAVVTNLETGFFTHTHKPCALLGKTCLLCTRLFTTFDTSSAWTVEVYKVTGMKLLGHLKCTQILR